MYYKDYYIENQVYLTLEASNKGSNILRQLRHDLQNVKLWRTLDSRQILKKAKKKLFSTWQMNRKKIVQFIVQIYIKNVS